MWLFAIFVIVPIIEIALFIQVGGALGLFPTLAIVILTAAAGTILVRSQGLSTLRNLQRGQGAPAEQIHVLAHGAMILVAGLLLLTPGFFTDFIGFALLTPFVRRAIITSLYERITAMQHQTSPQTAWDDDIEDAQVIDVAPYSSDDPSGWTRK